MLLQNITKDVNESALIPEGVLNDFHRKTFNENSFKCVYSGDAVVFPEDTKRSQQLTDQQYNKIVETLKDWDQENKVQELQHRKSNHNGYHWRKQFMVAKSTAPDGKVTWRLHRNDNDEQGKLCVPMSQVFDAIKDAHVGLLAHLKANPTHKAVQMKYSNITFHHCREFCRLCPVCLKSHPSIKKQKGADKPLTSLQFRDRFQIDLIDMRTKPATNIYNIIMRYIVTVKDHLTGFVCLSCIPRKRPIYVTYELQMLFGMIGFPYIFHTDNGKEFIAAEVLRLLKSISPAITTVTGRPRTPNDQGSVENMNRIVKRLIQNCEEEERQRGGVPNWSMYLGRIMAAINSMEQRGKYNVSAYEAVFGLQYSGSEHCSLTDLRKCNTVEERLNLVASPRFDSIVKILYADTTTTLMIAKKHNGGLRQIL
jgi:transposase InsO family protein